MLSSQRRCRATRRHRHCIPVAPNCWSGGKSIPSEKTHKLFPKTQAIAEFRSDSDRFNALRSLFALRASRTACEYTSQYNGYKHAVTVQLFKHQETVHFWQPRYSGVDKHGPNGV